MAAPASGFGKLYDHGTTNKKMFGYKRTQL